MPDEEKVVEKAAEAPVMVDASKLGAEIAKGLAATLPEAMRATQPVQQVRQEPIDDVDENDIFNAVEAGDKTKAAALLRKQRNADRERIRREDLSPILSNGGNAISQVSQLAVKDDPVYKTYKKEVDQQVENWRRANPGQVASPEIWQAALKWVRGEHSDEITNAAVEAAIRKAKEPPVDLSPSGRHLAEAEEQEPKTLSEALGGDWKTTWGRKQRAPGVRGRTEDEEMNRLGFGNVEGFLGARKELQAMAESEDMASFGLDRDWDPREKRWLTPEESRRLPIPQE